MQNWNHGIRVFPNRCADVPLMSPSSFEFNWEIKNCLCHISSNTNLALLGEVIFKVPFSDSTRQTMNIECVSRICSIIPEISCEGGSHQTKLQNIQFKDLKIFDMFKPATASRSGSWSGMGPGPWSGYWPGPGSRSRSGPFSLGRRGSWIPDTFSSLLVQ